MILLMPCAVSRSTSPCTAATGSEKCTLGPGLASSSVSSGVSPIRPSFSPPRSITVDFKSFVASICSPEKSAFDISTGNSTASMNPRSTSGPSSNSWLPAVIAS